MKCDGVRRAAEPRGEMTATESDTSGRESPAGEGQWRLKRTVVMVGMMGSGKTAIGRALAARLHVPFLDSDHEIERAAAETIPEIFARDGEAFFRARESEVIRRLMQGPVGVLSTGGGAFLAERNREAIAASGVSVWLDAPLPLLWDRVRHKESRPLLRTADPKGTLTRLYEERVPIYRLAQVRVPAKRGLTIEGMTTRVIDALAARDDILEPL